MLHLLYAKLNYLPGKRWNCPRAPKLSGTPECLKCTDLTDYMITYQWLILVLDTLDHILPIMLVWFDLEWRYFTLMYWYLSKGSEYFSHQFNKALWNVENKKRTLFTFTSNLHVKTHSGGRALYLNVTPIHEHRRINWRSRKLQPRQLSRETNINMFYRNHWWNVTEYIYSSNICENKFEVLATFYLYPTTFQREMILAQNIWRAYKMCFVIKQTTQQYIYIHNVYTIRAEKISRLID